MRLKFAYAPALTVLLLSVCQAQTGGTISAGGGLPGPVMFGPGAGVSAGFGHRAGMRRFGNSEVILGAPLWYADYPYENAAPSQPQIVVVQVPAASTAPAPPEIKPEPLLIELQGDRYVRLSGGNSVPEASDRPAGLVEMAAAKPPAAGKSAAKPVHELRPVVLVYRDGRREQVRDYTIADGTIYVRGDYWTDGFWTKQIKLAALNLSATEKASAENGAKFVLPAGPNQIVTRP
jgi:hypothetical protein